MPHARPVGTLLSVLVLPHTAEFQRLNDQKRPHSSHTAEWDLNSQSLEPAAPASSRCITLPMIKQEPQHVPPPIVTVHVESKRSPCLAVIQLLVTPDWLEAQLSFRLPRHAPCTHGWPAHNLQSCAAQAGVFPKRTPHPVLTMFVLFFQLFDGNFNDCFCDFLWKLNFQCAV